MFVVVGMSFSTTRKSDKSIWYILEVEVALGYLLTKFMDCSDVKFWGIHYGIVKESGKVAY